jgi:prevent-host-death family protein
MSQITISEAAQRLDELIDESRAGGDVVLTRDNHPVAKIIPLLGERPRPRFGSGKDFIAYIAPDFDEIPEGFEEYMP